MRLADTNQPRRGEAVHDYGDRHVRNDADARRLAADLASQAEAEEKLTRAGLLHPGKGAAGTTKTRSLDDPASENADE
jgi:hypothetical protein